MADFDPDAYLGKKAAPAAPAPAFDPDAYLRGAPAPQQEVSVGRKIRNIVGPSVEMIGSLAGGVVGAGGGGVLGGPPGAIAGAVGGAGLGYGISKEMLEYLDVAMGWKQPRQGMENVTEPLKNIAEGATYEAGGQVLGKLVTGGAQALANRPRAKAAKIVTQSLGGRTDEALNALRTAPEGATAAQALSSTRAPTTQALIERAAGHDPYYLGGTVPGVTAAQTTEGANALAQLTGGRTATEVRAATDAAKGTVRATMEPVKEAALTQANLGQQVAKLESISTELGKEAAGKVQQVRSLESAKGKALDAYYRYGVDKATGQVVPGQQATHMGNLAKDAERWASQAATASLDLGQGSRFAEAAAESLRAQGIAPLKSDAVVSSIKNIVKDPELAGNADVQAVVKRLARDISEWTSKGGVIDARALDAIRKNSVTAAINDLYKGDPTAQKRAAAAVMERIKPLIIDAIEAAGGKGYRQYLADYSAGMQEIAKTKLAGEAQRLFKESPEQFVKLVKGESPEVVEKFLGKGNYDIGQELADGVMQTLRKTAGTIEAGGKAAAEARQGQQALRDLLEANVSKFRLPWTFGYKAVALNEAIATAEKKLGHQTMLEIAKASRNAQDFEALLRNLPPATRQKVTKWASDPSQWGLSGASLSTSAALGMKNALSDSNRNQNTLAE